MNTVPLSELEKDYPESFRPLVSMIDNPIWKAKGLEVYRCSAFPKFLSNLKEVVELVDHAKKTTKDLYRYRFKNFLSATIALAPAYCRAKRDLFAKQIHLVSDNLAIGMSEGAFFDIYIPELELIFLGHDDFGLNILKSHEKQIDNRVLEIVKKNNLYILGPL